MWSQIKKVVAVSSALAIFLSAALLLPVTSTALAQSPTNGKIVFASYRDGNWEIYLMDADGSNLTNLTNHPSNDHSPGWSPDGQQIAFTSDRSGDWEIYIMGIDGSGVTRITTTPGSEAYPAWSPDGTRLAFHRNIGRQEMFVINIDGTNETQLTNTPGYDNFTANWTPDSAEILFSSRRGPGNNSDHWWMNADGSNERPLTDTGTAEADPNLSLDGSKIVFYSNRDGNHELYVMNSDGSNEHRLTFDPGNDHLPFWSPDGTRIGFTSDRDGDNDIYVMNADGSGVVNLTPSSPAHDTAGKWQPVVDTGCGTDVPATAYQYDTFTLTLDCASITANVFGFQAGHTITTGDTLVTAQATTYTFGTIFQGQSVLTGENELDTYALSLQTGGTEATGDFTLGSVDYSADFPGDATFDLINLILGDRLGNEIPNMQASPSTATITIIDVVDTLNGVVDPEGHALDTELEFALEGNPTIGPINTVYNPDGTTSFTLNDIHGHPAHLDVDAPSHLTCQEPLPFSGDETDVTLPDPLNLRAGDVNSDEAIDITDASAIGQQYGNAASGELDINNDGTINILDLIHVGRNYALTGPTECVPTTCNAVFDNGENLTYSLPVAELDFSIDGETLNPLNRQYQLATKDTSVCATGWAGEACGIGGGCGTCVVGGSCLLYLP